MYEDELRQQKIRLQYLQMQIRPHFLVNALNSIRTMIDMKYFENAQEMCFHLADYFRQWSGIFPKGTGGSGRKPEYSPESKGVCGNP